MTSLSSFGPIDAALWSAAVVLLLVALWLSRPGEVRWEIASFFAAVWGAMLRPAPLPLREGAVPPEGWAGDPSTLGEDYDPVVRIGAGCTWEALAADAPAAREALSRRLSEVRALWVGPPLFDLPGIVAATVDPGGDAGGDVGAQADVLLGEGPARLVLLTRSHPGHALRALHAHPGLRDRTCLVVFLAAELDAEREWLAEHFTHAAFDLELHDRVLPFLTLRVPDGGAQVLRAPPSAATANLAVVDLGVVPAEALADPQLPRALAATIAAVFAG